MVGSTAHLRSDLSKGLGKRIRRVARILFVRKERPQPNDGALELEMDDGSVLLLDGASDGESLRVRSEAWLDPFQPPLSDENAQYVEEHGKWSRVDVSGDAPYAPIIGTHLLAVTVLENEHGRVAGVCLSTEGPPIWFAVAGDESHVHWGHPIGFREIVTYGAPKDGANADM